MLLLGAAADCLAGLPLPALVAFVDSVIKRQEMLEVVVAVVCCPTTVTLPAAEEVVWLMGTDTCGQRSNLEKVGYTPTGKHLWAGIRWAWRTLGTGPGLLGRVVGKATYHSDSPTSRQ